ELRFELALAARDGDDEVTERRKGVLPRRALGERLLELVSHVFEVAEEDVFLAREVREDRPGRDAGGLRDVGERRRVVAALDEELEPRAGDRVAGLLLLPLPVAGRRRLAHHGERIILLHR